MIQWGTYHHGHYDRLIRKEIYFPISYTYNYSVLINPIDEDNEDIYYLETSAVCVQIKTVSYFWGKIYGYTDSDTPYGFTWISVGY